MLKPRLDHSVTHALCLCNLRHETTPQEPVYLAIALCFSTHCPAGYNRTHPSRTVGEAANHCRPKTPRRICYGLLMVFLQIPTPQNLHDHHHCHYIAITIRWRSKISGLGKTVPHERENKESRKTCSILHFRQPWKK